MLNLPAPAEGSEQYLRLCGRYGLGKLQSLAQSPDRSMLAIGGTDLALIFNSADGKILHRYLVDGGVRGVSFTPDGTKLAVGTPTQIQLFDVNLETAIASVKVPVPDKGRQAEEFNAVVFAPDGASFATPVTGSNPVVRFYSAAGQVLREIPVASPPWGLNPFAFVPETSELLLLTETGVASISPTGSEATTLYPMPTVPLAVATAPGGLIGVGSGAKDTNVWVWRRGETTPLLQKSITGGTGSVAFSSDGRLVAAANSFEMHVWEVATGIERLSYNPKLDLDVISQYGVSLRFDASDDAVLLNDKFRIHSYRLGDATEGQGYGWGHDGLWTSAAISPDGSLLASAARDQVIVWKRSDESIVARLVPPGSVLSEEVTFSGDARRVYTTAAGTIYEWDLATGALLRSLKLDISLIESLVTAPDGKMILAGLGAHEFVTVSTETLQPIAHAPALDTFALQAAFSADSSAFVGTINDHELGAWDARSGASLATADLGITSIQFSPIFFASRGTRVVTAAGDTVWVFSWPGLAPKYRLQSKGGIQALALLGDDRHVLSVADNVVLWDIDRGQVVSEGSVDVNHVPRLALPQGMSASLLLVHDSALRLYCNALAKPNDPVSFGPPPR